jgi:hypothetical protein
MSAGRSNVGKYSTLKLIKIRFRGEDLKTGCIVLINFSTGQAIDWQIHRTAYDFTPSFYALSHLYVIAVFSQLELTALVLPHDLSPKNERENNPMYYYKTH